MLVAVVAGVIVGTRPETEAAAPAQTVSVPLFTSASSAGVQSFVRIINHSGDAGTAAIEAIDDDGASYGPLDLAIRAGEAVHLDAGDLEDGDTGKGLSRSTGPGSGSWRLEITSTLDLEVLPYVLASDGFVTGMHDVVPYTRTGYRVALFQPASNARQVSRLRLSNPGGEPAAVTIEGMDDAGASPGTAVRLTLAAGASRTLSAQDLETGEADGLSGALGDGTGRWRLTINASEPLLVLNLVAGSATGRVSNLSSVPANVTDGDDGATTLHAVPWLPSASREDLSGLVRVINHTDQAGIVAIEAFDDSGTKHGPARLFIGALGTRHFDAEVLEAGDIGSGLWGGTGSGTGDWRLQLGSTLNLEVLSYVHAPGGEDGLLSGMHDVVPRNGAGHRVTVFDPDRVPGAIADSDDAPGQVSRLRLINPGDTAAAVTITGADGDGEAPETVVRLSLAPGASRTVAVPELEAGEAEGLSGALGDGAGRWHLEVRSDRRIQVMHLLSGPSGDVANLSTAPGAPGAGPLTAGATTNTATAAELFGEHISDAIVQGRCVTCHIAGGVSGNTRLVFARDTAADHEATNLQAFRSFTADVAEGADLILSKVQGVSHGGGQQLAAGSADFANLEQFLERLETPADVFGRHVSAQVVQARCVTCHVAGGASGSTRLVFVPDTVADHEAVNRQAFAAFLSDVDGGADLILSKAQGVSHGGGVQLTAGSEGLASLERFLGRLDTGEATSAAITPETLFDTVRMAPVRTTLRRATLIFAGRLPTDAEYAAAHGSGGAALRATIRGMMTGPAFHEFLVRGANDRLLTDRRGRVLDSNGHLPGYTNESYDRRKAAEEEDDLDEFYAWRDRVEHGARRAPVELIAHVVENDLPYTEVLTADYIMANPWSAKAYGASTRFDDAEDMHGFRPSRIEDYHRKGDGYEYEYTDFGLRVLDPGPLHTEYPHAGVLNTLSFLVRYPSTATNRNRARARWTYYHFLGVDIEKSASRTTDPVALADTNNPTLLNSACTVCHKVMDPVAGAFQNYGDEGWYKNQWGGEDSLDRLYKEDRGTSREIRSASSRHRDTLSWQLPLSAGLASLKVEYSNHFWDDEAREGGEVYLDHLTVRTSDGVLVVRREFEQEAIPVAHWGRCGERKRSYLRLWGGYRECALWFEIEIPEDDTYDLEIDAWSIGEDERFENGNYATIGVISNPYEEGDSWYRDMLSPGFGAELAPDPDNSLQWLAQQIVEDERFAEATVKFWWPAIMGSETTDPPEDEADAGFEGQLLAANAQHAEVARLALGFRLGYGRRSPYNLKDLLVEMVLSKWFRSEAVPASDPVRSTALHDAGARRLLTPEELSRKTAALTGFEWGRHIRTSCWPECDPEPSALTDLNDFRLLYGGIDSDGITERARDITSVMAGVAKRHAVRSSCPIVARELYLLPDAERRLFSGVEPFTQFGVELEATFEIEAEHQDGEDYNTSWETVSLSGPLTAGARTARLSFLNEFWEPEPPHRGRHVRLDRLDVRDATGGTVASYELENLTAPRDCNHSVHDHFGLHCTGWVDVPIEIPAAGRYTIEIVARADHAGDERPRLRVSVLDPARAARYAEHAVRSKLVELHETLLGVHVAPHSPDVEAAYRIFVEAAARRRDMGEDRFNHWDCAWQEDKFFFEGILDDAVREELHENGRWYHEFDWGRIDPFLDSVDWSDPVASAQAWVVVLTYLLMDYRYLYL